MAAKSDIPFNVSLLVLTPKKLEGVKPVRVLDIFDGISNNFHEDGLFSVSTFGKPGDERRNMRFSYINVKVPIFHPIIFRALTTLKRMYLGIISGTDYAVWDDSIKDFVRADALSGSTGFAFFTTHWDKIVFPDTKSDKREQNILMIKKYLANCLTTNVIVLPAGLRDIEVGNDGRIKEDEINGIYRKLLAVSNTISDSAVRSNPEIVNVARYNLQCTFNELYDLIESMLSGKKKLVMDKFASRRLMNGTRNVITAMDTSTPYLGAVGSVNFNNTIIGLYQFSKALMPVVRFHVRTGFLSKVFLSVGADAVLVNKKTLKKENVSLKSSYFDRWATDEGVEKVITSFSEDGIRHRPLEIEGYWVGLIYKGPDNTFKIIQDISEVPPTRSKEDVWPLTFCELLYLSCYSKVTDYPLFLTRYPITGIGSIYPSIGYVKTSVKSEQRSELGDTWEPMGSEFIAYEFPTKGEFVNSLVPHSSKLAGLTADFDGDTSSANVTYSDESKKEVKDYLTKKVAYVNVDGTFTSSVNVETVGLVLHNLTG
jgi:hypothetical protein